eukprot:sb/3478182/
MSRARTVGSSRPENPRAAAREQIIREAPKYNKNRNSTPRVLEGFNKKKPLTQEELRKLGPKSFQLASSQLWVRFGSTTKITLPCDVCLAPRRILFNHHIADH